MNVCDIDAIPAVDLDVFLAIIQSIVRFERGKNRALPLPYLDIKTFANKQWQDFDCSKEDIHNSVEYCKKMFLIKEDVPDLHSDFGTFAEECYNKWKKTDRNITFFTSGSTSIPKPCVHSEANLRQEIISLLPNVQGCKRALITVPHHHMYGFTHGLLLPRALGVPIQIVAPFPAIVANALQKHDFVIGIPLLYDHLCDIEDLSGDDICCIGGTSPLAEGTFQKMLDKGFNFIEYFGSSELGVFCYRKSPNDPYTLLAHLIEVKEDGSLDRMLPNGKIMHCPVQDSIEKVDKKHLITKGRKDFAVQVGGINVFPAHVCKILETHSMVKHCLVRLMRADEGNRLKAFIVPSVNMDEKMLRNEISSFIKSNFNKSERPVSITLGKELPRNIIGKLSDW